MTLCVKGIPKAAADGDIARVRALLDEGTNVNFQGKVPSLEESSNSIQQNTKLCCVQGSINLLPLIELSVHDVASKQVLSAIV